MASMHDPISDFLTILRNAARAKHPSIEVRASKLVQRVAELLRDEGYVANVKLIKEKPQKVVKVTLKYDGGMAPVFQSLKRVSRPSSRRYVAADDVKKVLGGMGISIISTSKGLMTDRQARQARLGGEILCEVF